MLDIPAGTQAGQKLKWKYSAQLGRWVGTDMALAPTLLRQIRKKSKNIKTGPERFSLTLNPEDNSCGIIYIGNFLKAYPLPPLHGPGGMAYSDFEKREVFKDTPKLHLGNEEPYCDDKIEEAESLGDDFFDNFTTCTPLSLPSEVRVGSGGEISGLHIDSRLTFKKHIDYLSEKFWGRISLAISLVGRRSPLSLENKVILYKQILRPVITYGSPFGEPQPPPT
ncbi:uncharacterized protein TNCV_3001431 [Trichonephila clavipes]|nr:uncharacterized protein TNCV_3001431 [Trichonephila clavipes]